MDLNPQATGKPQESGSSERIFSKQIDRKELKRSLDSPSAIIAGPAFKKSSLAYRVPWSFCLQPASWLRIKNTDISSHLKLPPVKIHCSVLAEEAIQVRSQLVALLRMKLSSLLFDQM